MKSMVCVVSQFLFHPFSPYSILATNLSFPFSTLSSLQPCPIISLSASALQSPLVPFSSLPSPLLSCSSISLSTSSSIVTLSSPLSLSLFSPSPLPVLPPHVPHLSPDPTFTHSLSHPRRLLSLPSYQSPPTLSFPALPPPLSAPRITPYLLNHRAHTHAHLMGDTYTQGNNGNTTNQNHQSV